MFPGSSHPDRRQTGTRYWPIVDNPLSITIRILRHSSTWWKCSSDVISDPLARTTKRSFRASSPDHSWWKMLLAWATTRIQHIMVAQNELTNCSYDIHWRSVRHEVGFIVQQGDFLSSGAERPCRRERGPHCRSSRRIVSLRSRASCWLFLS